MRLIQKVAVIFSALQILSGLSLSAQHNNLSLNTICIDAGHGGKDAGCVSRDKKVLEKNIVLSVAKELQALIEEGYPEVKVVLTRKTDVFVPLNDRAAIANKANADLFISIHVNAPATYTTQPSGYSIHTLGQSSIKGNDLYKKNLDLCKRENSVIMLEDDYSTTYQGFDPSDPESYILFSMIQNSNLEQSLLFADDIAGSMSGGPIKKCRGISQDPFLVLWRTGMPSVLVEIGFITNPDDLATMRSEEGRKKIARNIYNAFSAFKSRYDGSLEIKNAGTVQNKAAEVRNNGTAVQKNKTPASASTPEKNDVFYGTQILASSKKLSPNDRFFRGKEVRIVECGKLYKYFVGVSQSQDEARKLNLKLKEFFPDSFFVKVSGETVTRVR